MFVRRAFSKTRKDKRVLLARESTPVAHTYTLVTRGEQEMTLACNGVPEAQSTTDSEAE